MKNQKIWTYQNVADQLEEAIVTLVSLPPVKVQGYISSWPQIIYSRKEVEGMEAIPTPALAAPDAISRLDQTSEWMQWIDEKERRLVWQRAAGVRWKVITIEMRCSRSTAWQRWMIACEKIAARLNCVGSV